jgi:hypothetical protein
MFGRFEVVLNALQRRNHKVVLQELSTGNWYRGRTLLKSLQVQPDEPGYNPGLRFAEVEYRDQVQEGTQGFIGWIVPNGNPGQRLWLYRVSTVQNWVSPASTNPVGTPGYYWQPDLVNGQRQ